MGSTHPTIEIEQRSEISISYTKYVPAAMSFRPAQRWPNNCHYLIIPETLISVGTQLCLITDPAHCLVLIRSEIWAPIRDKVLELPSSVPKFEQLKRLLIGNSRDDVSVDTRHRLELAVELAEFAQLEKTAYWVQKDRLVELWNPDLYAQGDGSSWLGRQLDKKVSG